MSQTFTAEIYLAKGLYGHVFDAQLSKFPNLANQRLPRAWARYLRIDTSAPEPSSSKSRYVVVGSKKKPWRADKLIGSDDRNNGGVSISYGEELEGSQGLRFYGYVTPQPYGVQMSGIKWRKWPGQNRILPSK